MTTGRSFMLAAYAVAAAMALGMPSGAFAEDRTGSFEGRNDHVTTGGARLVKTDAGYAIELGEDFSLDGAPDPRVGLGKGGTFDAATDLGALQHLTGAQSYAIPAGVDVSAYDEVYIWCKEFNVPLGVAVIE